MPGSLTFPSLRSTQAWAISGSGPCAGRRRGDIMHAPRLLDVLIEELCLARMVNGRRRPLVTPPSPQPDQRWEGLGVVVARFGRVLRVGHRRSVRASVYPTAA